MSVGYSGTPLIKKLGIKPGMRVCLLNAPDEYLSWLGEAVEHSTVLGPCDFVHAFLLDRTEYEDLLSALRSAIFPNGMVWISWPKKASKVPTTLDENVIRDLALANGLVDVKVCAVSDVWSGLKLVVRVKDRGASP